MTEIVNQLDLSKVNAFSEHTHEIARIWVTHKGPSIVFINARTLPDPGQFGQLMAETVQHGARAYAKALGIGEDEAVRRIRDGFRAQREEIGGLEEMDWFGRND